MMSFLRNLKQPIIIAILFVASILLFCSSTYYAKRQQLKFVNDLISVCKFEIKNKASHPEAITFDPNEDYTISTSNPSIWHVYGKATIEIENYGKTKVGTFCRVIRVNNNLQVDRWEYHIEK
jgi:hypothetical protein